MSAGGLVVLPFRLCLEAPALGSRLLEGGSIEFLSQRSKASIHGKETFSIEISSLSRRLH